MKSVQALKDLSVFVHIRYMDLLVWLFCICQTQQTRDINASFGASLDFSQKIHGFSKSNHLHLQSGDLSTFVRVCCFLHCSSIGIHLSNPFSLSPSYSVMNGDGKKYLVMDGDGFRDGTSPDFSQKKNCIYQLQSSIQSTIQPFPFCVL